LLLLLSPQPLQRQLRLLSVTVDSVAAVCGDIAAAVVCMNSAFTCDYCQANISEEWEKKLQVTGYKNSPNKGTR